MKTQATRKKFHEKYKQLWETKQCILIQTALKFLFRYLKINHLSIPIKYRSLKSGQTKTLEQAIPAVFHNRTGCTSWVVSCLMSERRSSHRREFPINIKNWFQKTAVLKVFCIGDRLITVVKVISHVPSNTPPCFTRATKFFYIHCFLPEFLPFRSNPSFITVFKTAMATS